MILTRHDPDKCLDNLLDVPLDSLAQPKVKMRIPLHSTGDASRLAALLFRPVFCVFSLVASCQPSITPVSVQRWAFITYY